MKNNDQKSAPVDAVINYVSFRTTMREEKDVCPLLNNDENY